jgi:methionyl-tRNA formyltransferase
LKIIFAGTPTFAATSLQALLAHQYDVVAVLTQPDRPAGRGMQLTGSPVKQLAMQRGVTVLQPQTLKSAEIQDQLAAYQADVMIVAAYGLILPQAVLNMPRYGCLNSHASLLPRWRGAAPVQRAILAGDEASGITIMQMDAGLDTGSMLLKKTCPIDAADTAQTLLEKLGGIGSEAILEVLRELPEGRLIATEQDASQATYAAKLSKSEAQLDWSQSARKLERAVRGYNPFPVASAQLHGTSIKIYRQAHMTTATQSRGRWWMWASVAY